jgi:hexulose-6-phosphate isomerase
MQVAVSQLVAPDSWSVSQFLQEAKATGYEGVELSVRAADNAAFNYNSTDAELAAWKAEATALGLDIGSITIANKVGSLVVDGAAADSAIAETAWALECAAKLGATAALHTLGGLSPDLYYEDAYNNAVRNLKALAPVAEKCHVTLAIEFVWSGFLFSPLEMRQLIDTVGSSEVGFYFDPGNMAVFQAPQHWVRALGKRVRRVHMKDWKGGPLNGTWTPLLAGTLNFPVIMKELKAAGYQGPLVSEVPDSLASWKDTAAAIRQIASM